jgi:hypothetical protein
MIFGRQRGFWLCLFLIVAAAVVPRLLSYDFSLPYIDHPDEPNKYLGAQQWRGLYDSRGYYDGYPPGYVVVHLGVQYTLEALGQPGMSAAVRVLRLVSVGTDLLTIILLALTARLAAGNLAGLAAGAAWASAPLVIENNVYALQDPTIATLAALALWLAATALLDPQRRFWCVWSVVVGLVATWLKYSALPLIVPGGLVALVLLTQNRALALRLLAFQAVLTCGFLGWLFFIYGIDVSSVEREGATIRESGVANLLVPARVANNLYYTIYPIQPVAFAVVGALGALAYIAAWRRQQARVHLGVVLLSAALALVIPWLVSAYMQAAANYRMRDVLPATAAVCIIFGAALGQLLLILPMRARPYMAAAIIALLTVFVYLPQGGQTAQLVESRQPFDRRTALRAWADVNLEPGTVLVGQRNEKTFNPFWSGLQGRYWFDWWVTDDVMEYPLDEWVNERGMSYVVFDLDDLAELQADPVGSAYLEPMLHLRDFDAPDQRGPEMAVYRLWRMQHETDARFGDAIRMVGYDQSGDTLDAGETLRLRFYWQAAATPAANYSLFVHLTPLDTFDVLAQADGSPAAPERLTLTWDDPRETIIGRWFDLVVPADLSAGDYQLRVGLYDFNTGARLPINVDGGDSLALTRVRIR